LIHSLSQNNLFFSVKQQHAVVVDKFSIFHDSKPIAFQKVMNIITVSVLD
jgi:hypothetical protein